MTAVTTDDFYKGRVKLIQPAKGFRAGTDSLLLAAALDADQHGSALDIGCGAGGALLPAAFRLSETQFTGLEIDADMAALARKSVDANAMADRVEIVQASAAELPGDWQNRFDTVFSNPPFFDPGTIQSPSAGKEIAYLTQLPLKAWLQAMLYALRPKGTFVMVHRAAELARILSVIERQVGEITVLPVHSYPGADAKRVLVRARKGLRSGPMRLLEPRYLYQGKGQDRTDWAINLQENAAGIAWN